MDGTCTGSLSVLHSKLRLPAAKESIPAPRISEIVQVIRSDGGGDGEAERA